MAAYATVEQLRAQPGVTGTSDDVTIQLMLDAAAEAIDGFCNRADDGFQAIAVAEDRLYKGNGYNYIYTDEAVEFTGLQVRLNSHSSWMIVPLDEIMGFSGSPQHPNFNRFPFHGILLISQNTIIDFPNGEIWTGWFFDAHDVPVESPTVKVSGRWGYADTVPSVIIQANILQAARWLKRGQSFWADTAATGEGQLSYRRSIDPDLEMMLKNSRMIRPLYG